MLLPLPLLLPFSLSPPPRGTLERVGPLARNDPSLFLCALPDANTKRIRSIPTNVPRGMGTRGMRVRRERGGKGEGEWGDKGEEGTREVRGKGGRRDEGGQGG